MTNLPKNPTREQIAEILYECLSAHNHVIKGEAYNGRWGVIRNDDMGKFIYSIVDYVMAHPNDGPVGAYEKAFCIPGYDPDPTKFDDLTPMQAYAVFLACAVVTSQMGWIEERPSSGDLT